MAEIDHLAERTLRGQLLSPLEQALRTARTIELLDQAFPTYKEEDDHSVPQPDIGSTLHFFTL